MTRRLRMLIVTVCALLAASASALGNPPENEGTTIDRFSLILYAFDSDEPGAQNQRILDEYVFPEIAKGSEITVVGYSDVVGQERHNFDLAERRARKIADRIVRRFGSDGYRSLTAKAVGEEQAPYRYDLPEGRLLSRTVIITVRTEGERNEWKNSEE